MADEVTDDEHDEPLASFADVKREFDRLSFRWPGWKIDIYEERYGAGLPFLALIRFRYETTGPDGQPIRNGRHWLVDRDMPAVLFVPLFRQQISLLLGDTADGWLTQDGTVVREPGTRY